MVLVSFGCLKKHQDLDERSFIQLQVAQAYANAGRSTSSTAIESRLHLNHRDALLRIYLQERLIHQQEAKGSWAEAASTKETIRREVDNLSSSAIPTAVAASNSYVLYEKERERENKTALNIDSDLLMTSLATLIVGAGVWIIEYREWVSEDQR